MHHAFGSSGNQIILKNAVQRRAGYSSLKTRACLACIILWLAAASGLYAQSNYQDGLIITHSGDSLRGQIDDRDWILNPDVIRFRRDSASETQLFTPRDLKTFHVSERRYKGATVSVDKNSLFFNRAYLPYAGKVHSTRNKAVFLLALVRGPLNLYYYQNKRDHFYLEKAADIVELISHQYFIKRDGTYRLISNEEYSDQIKQYATDCPEVKTDDLYYSRKSLAGFVAECNTHIDPPVSEYMYRHRRPVFRSQIFFGVTRTNFKMTFGDIPVHFTSSNDITFGYSAVLTFPGGRGQRSIFTDLQFHTFESYNEETYSIQLTDPFCTTTGGYHGSNTQCNVSRVEETLEAMVVKFSYLRLAAGFRNQLRAGRLRPFLDFGLYAAKRLHQNATGLRTLELYHFEGDRKPEEDELELIDSYTEREKIMSPHNIAVGGFIGIGIKYRRFSIALRKERGIPFTRNISAPRGMHLLAGFDFIQ